MRRCVPLLLNIYYYKEEIDVEVSNLPLQAILCPSLFNQVDDGLLIIILKPNAALCQYKKLLIHTTILLLLLFKQNYTVLHQLTHNN